MADKSTPYARSVPQATARADWGRQQLPAESPSDYATRFVPALRSRRPPQRVGGGLAGPRILELQIRQAGHRTGREVPVPNRLQRGGCRYTTGASHPPDLPGAPPAPPCPCRGHGARILQRRVSLPQRGPKLPKPHSGRDGWRNGWNRQGPCIGPARWARRKTRLGSAPLPR